MRLTVREKRLVAKAGLVASLSIVSLTGFHKASRSMGIHLAAGLVLVALALWHARLYARSVKRVATPLPSRSQRPEAPVAEPMSIAA